MFTTACERRIRDEATTFCETHHRIGKRRSWGWRWLTCDLCDMQERGFGAWMWSVPTPQTLPEPSDDPLWPDIMPRNVTGGVYDLMLCRMCAPTRAAARVSRRELFFSMDWQDCAKLVRSARAFRRLNIALSVGRRLRN
jgi:hypothetical protein